LTPPFDFYKTWKVALKGRFCLITPPEYGGIKHLIFINQGVRQAPGMNQLVLNKEEAVLKL